jgi:membrane protein implicated in regulation of membrane protease activity
MFQHYQEKHLPMSREEHAILQERSRNLLRMPLIVLPFLLAMAWLLWWQFTFNDLFEILFFGFFLAILVVMGGIVSLGAWRAQRDLQEQEKRVHRGLLKGKREEISTSRSTSGSGSRTQYRYYITLNEKEIPIALELFEQVREGDALEISEARHSRILLSFKKYNSDGQVLEEKHFSGQPVVQEQWRKAYVQEADSPSTNLGKIALNAEETGYLHKVRREALLKNSFLAIVAGAFLTMIGGGLVLMLASLLLLYLEAPKMAFGWVLLAIFLFAAYQIYRYIKKQMRPYEQELRDLQKQVSEVLVEDKIRTNALLKIKDGSLIRNVSKRHYSHLKLGGQYYVVSQELFHKVEVGDVLLLEKLPWCDKLLRLARPGGGEELYHFSRALIV